MIEVQKYWNKISQRDGYFHSKIRCVTLDLLCTVVLGTTICAVCSCLEISLLYRFKYAYLCL